MAAIPLTCTPKSLPRQDWVAAAHKAVLANPSNQPRLERLVRVMPEFQLTPERIAVVTTKYWGKKGVRLTVGFFDSPSSALRARILQHMNAWGKSANVKFVASSTDPQVRIAFEASGYWSYVGTDILSIPRSRQTMNLQEFTMDTPDSEFYRVVRHETGHTLGFPHEHMRRELVEKIDPDKAIKFFGDSQGWSEAEVRQQVLTPIEEASIRGTAHADPRSIMCYQIPGTITRDGKPILGGRGIVASDYAFAKEIYPTLKAAPQPKSKTKAAPKGKTVGKRGAARKKKARRSK